MAATLESIQPYIEQLFDDSDVQKHLARASANLRGAKSRAGKAKSKKKALKDPTLRQRLIDSAQAMVAGSLHEPLLTLAWPSAHLGPMGLEGAVQLAPSVRSGPGVDASGDGEHLDPGAVLGLDAHDACLTLAHRSPSVAGAAPVHPRPHQ